MVVSPNGSQVFAAGTSAGTGGTTEFVTVAYDTATGAKQWIRQYSANGRPMQAKAIAVSPDGSTVYVTGTSGARPANGVAYTRIVTIAYGAATGSPLWRANYGVRKQNSSAVALAVSPDGSTVFVTGTSHRRNGSYLATVAYSG